jgi:hypothetical protein
LIECALRFNEEDRLDFVEIDKKIRELLGTEKYE